MKKIIFLLFLIFLINCSNNSNFVRIHNDMNWNPKPIIEVKNQLSEMFEFYKFEFISGMSCQVKYNGKYPLPKSVYYEQYDFNGNLIKIDNKTRYKMIYPKMVKGETGSATFIKVGNPYKIKIFTD